MATTRTQALREAGFPVRSLDEIDCATGPAKQPRDMVVNPKHYSRFEIEPYYFCAVNKVNPFQFNIVKYTMRCEFKHETPFEDLNKVVRTAIMYAKFWSGDPEWHKPYRNQALARMIEEEMTHYARQSPVVRGKDEGSAPTAG